MSDSKQYRHACDAFFGSPWALKPEKFHEIAAFLRAKAVGVATAFEDGNGPAKAREPTPTLPDAARRGTYSQVAGKVGILDLFGVVSQRMNIMTSYSGGTSSELFGRDLDALVADKSIRSIIMVIDSPGGSVFGTPELANKVLQARNEKRIVAVADSMAASAAYWIGAQATELVVTPGGQVGSIGVVAAHQDTSKAEEQAGVKTTLVHAGKYKVEGDPSQPLTVEGREQIQKTVDTYYGMFVKAVARGRGVTEARVESDFGQGRMFTAKEAVAAGMADQVATLEQVLRRLDAPGGSQGPAGEVPAPGLQARLAAVRARSLEI